MRPVLPYSYDVMDFSGGDVGGVDSIGSGTQWRHSGQYFSSTLVAFGGFTGVLMPRWREQRLSLAVTAAASVCGCAPCLPLSISGQQTIQVRSATVLVECWLFALLLDCYFFWGIWFLQRAGSSSVGGGQQTWRQTLCVRGHPVLLVQFWGDGLSG